MKRYGKLMGLLIAGWFLFALSASALHRFRNDLDRIGVAVAIATLTPIVVFSLWLAASERFSAIRIVFEPENIDLIAVVENRGIRVRSPRGSSRPARNLCITCRVWRHGPWGNCCLRGMEAS
jgi:hypothetical protein